MPNIAEFHPQIVHFVVALLLVGVGMRVVSLTRLLPFTMGHKDSARAVLAPVTAAFPQNTRLKAKLDSIR